MSRSFLSIVVALLALVPARRARACASCSCGDETLTATGVERPYRNRVRLVAEERYGSLGVGDAQTGQHTEFLRSTLAASWSPHARLTLATQLPWITSFLRTPGRSLQQLNGLGDLELAARVLVYKERGFLPHHLVFVSGGLKMPTGPRLTDDRGYLVPDDDQPGSGSWDPFTGLTYAWFSGKLVSLFGSASYRYPTAGWHGYRRGMSLGVSAAVQVQPFRWGAIQLGADVLWQAADTLANGNPMVNSGGTVGYLAPGLLFNPIADLLVRVVVDAPVVAAQRGLQSVGPQVMLSISYDVR